MAEIVPYNNGLDFGQFPSAASLPEASGSPNTSASLRVGARAYVIDAGEYTCTDATSGAAVWALTGSVAAGAGSAIVGPFAGTTTVGAVLCLYSSGPFVAPRAGSITGISGWLDTAATGDDIVVEAFIGATPTAFAMTFSDGGNTEAYGTAAAGTYAVAAGDTVVMLATGGASLGNTPAFVGSVEFTPS